MARILMENHSTRSFSGRYSRFSNVGSISLSKRISFGKYGDTSKTAWISRRGLYRTEKIIRSAFENAVAVYSFSSESPGKPQSHTGPRLRPNLFTPTATRRAAGTI